mgnify:CR=1 FL=1
MTEGNRRLKSPAVFIGGEGLAPELVEGQGWG